MKKNTKTDTNTGSSSQHDNSLNESDSNKMRKSRRRLIQVLVAGGVVVTAKSVPNKWSRPVVEAVMLPAHAQTSGELITLGNNGNFNFGIFDSLVEEASAQDDQQLLCTFTGCSYIKYRKGDNNGQLFIGVFDNTADLAGPTDLVLNFTDGQKGSFSEPCLGPDIYFLVELKSDTLAKLTILFGEEIYKEIDLVNIFVCEPVEDGIVEDDS